MYHHKEEEAPQCILWRRRTSHTALQKDREVDHMLWCEEEEALHTIVPKRRGPRAGWCHKKGRICRRYSSNQGKKQ